MSIDIRSLLSVYPDRSSFTCVGTTQKGARCRNSWFSGTDLSCASRILDEMGSQEKHSISYKDLEKLAGLTLCPRWHRKPGYSQVRSVSLEWQTKIATYEAKVKREKEKAAMIKSERALAEMRKSLDDIKVKLEEAETDDKISSANIHVTKEQKTANRFATYDRAESRMQAISTKSIPKPVLAMITPPASAHNTPSRSSDTTTTVKTESDTTSSLASPPESPLVSKQHTSQEIKQEHTPPSSPTKAPASPQRQAFTITKTSSIRVTAQVEPDDLIPKTTTRERTKIETFNFEFPPTPEMTPPHPQSAGMKETCNFAYEFGARNQVPPPPFGVGISSKLPVPEDPSSGRDEFKRLKSTHGVSAFTFNPEYKPPSRSFDFHTPTKLSKAMRLPEKPSTIWDDFNTHADQNPLVSSEGDYFSPNEQSQHTPQVLTTPKTTPINSTFAPLTLNATPEPNRQPTHGEEDSYGFAIVTPSMRYSYKTYLPIQQRHGLMTPPETPEKEKDGYQDQFLAFDADTSLSPLMAILRKPLPSLPPPQPREGEAGLCGACGFVEDGCCCEEGSNMENGRVGCFHSSRLRRLRKIVVRKVKDVKIRVSGAVRWEIGSPKTH